MKTLPLREAFKLFDKDGDGTIDVDEFLEVFLEVGKKKKVKEIRKIVGEIDVDGNGEIDFEEFKLVMNRLIDHSNQEREFKELFYFFDLKGDGLIDEEEIHYTMNKILKEKISLKECREMVSIGDVNQDGLLSYDNFRSLLQTMDGKRLICGMDEKKKSKKNSLKKKSAK